MRAITGRWRRGRMHGARALLIAIGLVVSAVFMYIAVRGAHPQQTLDALRATNYALLVPSVLVLALAFFIRALRWHSLFSPQRPPLGAVVSAQFIGYLANAVLPVRAGEAAAIVALNRRAQTPVAEGTATMFLQRAEDVLSLLLLLFVMLPWLPEVTWLRAAGVVAVVLTVALAALAALVLRYGERAPANPWGATGLEWQTSSPPPTENFAVTPVVTQDAYDYHEAAAPVSEVLVRG